ncbi:hypothetical protein AU825_17000 [Salmonella enterica subsp. salamae]|nr:hypothetical protein [Salmonella enterica subsp. salamae]EDW5992794.1 N-acetyltransferase [Salmonella enterica subsp. salamae]
MAPDGSKDGSLCLLDDGRRDNINSRDNRSWLLTLPETSRSGEILPAISVLVHQSTGIDYERYYRPLHEDEDNAADTVILTQHVCMFTLYWKDGSGIHHWSYKTVLEIDIINHTIKLDLTDRGFEVPEVLRGRGLGSWLIHHLVLWARRFPPETPVAGILLGIADEKDETNRIRRDHLWTATGFRFRKGSRSSVALCIHDLQLPDYRKSSLQETSLEEGFFNLAEEYKQLLRDYESLEKLAENRNERIRYFEERYWKTRLKGALYSILLSFFRLRLKVSRKKRSLDDTK